MAFFLEPLTSPEALFFAVVVGAEEVLEVKQGMREEGGFVRAQEIDV